MAISTLTSKGQTTIPQEVREALGLRPGTRIVFEINGDSAVLRRQPGVMSLYGALKTPGSEEVDFATARAVALQEWAAEAEGEGR